MHSPQRRELRLSDGRNLEFTWSGPDQGTPLIFNTGSPASGELFGPLVADAAAHGLRTITYSRPGFGGSTPKPGRSVADGASDVAAILDALAAKRFITIGWSGGGPYALACAGLLGDRCIAVACVSGVAPQEAADLDWFAGMQDDNVEEYSAAARGIEALRPVLERMAPTYAGMQPADIAKGLSQRADLDQREVAAFRELIATSFRRAVESGIEGWLEDDLALAAPWAFDLATVSCPVSIWHGGRDHAMPAAHGAWLATHLSDTRHHLLADQGHGVLLLAAHRQIVDELVALAG